MKMKKTITLLLLLAGSLGYSQINSSSFSDKVAFTTGNKPYGIAITDLDKDEKNDLAVTNFDDNTVSVFLNQGSSGSITTSTFAARVNFTTATQPSHIATGDIDGDGLVDLIISNEGGAAVSILRNTSTIGNISFASKVDLSVGSGSPNSVKVLDLDQDGKLDITVSVYTSNKICVFRNTSTSGSISTDTRIDLTPSGGVSVRGMDAADLNGDTKLDLVCIDDFNAKMYVYENNASSGSITSGSFSSAVAFTTTTKPYSVEMADINDDGKVDILVNSNDGSKMSVYINQTGTGNISTSFFTTSVDFTTPSSPYYGLSADDLDGDGDLDVSLASIGGSAVSVYENVTSGTFGTSSLNTKVDFSTAAITTMSAVGDVDGDGMVDLLANGATGNKVYVFRNTMAPAGINTFSQKNPIAIYPNPVAEQLHVQFGEKTSATLQIFNSLGKLVYTSKVSEKSVAVETALFAKGMYILKVTEDITNKQYTTKFTRN